MRFFLFFVWLFILSSCDSNPSSPNTENDFTWLGNGSTVINKIHHSSDSEYRGPLNYRFYLDEPSVAIFKFEDTNFLDFTTYVSSGVYLGGVPLSANTLGDAHFTAEYLLPEGHFYLTVNNLDAVYREVSFKMSFEVDVSDKFEINNAIEAAKDISFNESVPAAIRPFGDLDYFKFTKSEDELNLTITSNGALAYKILDATSHNLVKGGILISDEGGEQTYNVSLDNLVLGSYIVRFSDENEGMLDEGAYSFRLD